MRKLLLLLPLITLLTGCGPSAEEKAEAARVAAEKKEEALKLELLEVCKDDLREVLKDPQSLRVLEYGARFFDEVRPPEYFESGDLMWGESNVALKFNYTATNSYGGRIRGRSFAYSWTKIWSFWLGINPPPKRRSRLKFHKRQTASSSVGLTSNSLTESLM